MECSICYENLNLDNNYVVTKCSHKFHYECLNRWVKLNNGVTCPLCRQDVIPNISESELARKLLDIMNTDDVIDKKTAILYLTYISQNIVSPHIYNSLILYNTKLLIDVMDDPCEYIMRHKLYPLLKYYDYDYYEDYLLDLDDVSLVKYIQFEQTTIGEIVRRGRINLLHYVINTYPEKITINHMYSNGYYHDNIFQKTNLLGVACLNGKLELLPILIQYFNINDVNLWNCTVLYPAIASGNMSIVKWLVRQGIDINITHKCGHSPLCYAIETKRDSIAWYLINNGSNINYQIIKACVVCSNNTRILTYLLKHTPKPIVQSKSPSLCSNRHIIKHIVDDEDCWCLKCPNYACKYVMPSLLQTACLYNKYEMILLLLNNNDIIYEPEFCSKIEYHLQNITDTDSETVLRALIANDLKILLEFDTVTIKCDKLYTHPCYKSVCDYILTLFKKDKHVSYKHQRKVLRKLVNEAHKTVKENQQVSRMFLQTRII